MDVVHSVPHEGSDVVHFHVRNPLGYARFGDRTVGKLPLGFSKGELATLDVEALWVTTQYVCRWHFLTIRDDSAMAA